MILAGGPVKMSEMTKRFSDVSKIQVEVAEDPDYSVIKGIEYLASNREQLDKVSIAIQPDRR